LRHPAFLLPQQRSWFARNRLQPSLSHPPQIGLKGLPRTFQDSLVGENKGFLGERTISRICQGQRVLSELVDIIGGLALDWCSRLMKPPLSMAAVCTGCPVWHAATETRIHTNIKGRFFMLPQGFVPPHHIQQQAAHSFTECVLQSIDQSSTTQVIDYILK
jgi:hypothetical protein